MAVACPVGLDTELLRSEVFKVYSRAATDPNCAAIGIEMTEAMRDRALACAALSGLTNVEVHLADATALPLPDASVDVVISNGVLNLVPEKEKAFAEIRRILRPGGRLQLADIVLDAELGEDVRRNIDLWTG